MTADDDILAAAARSMDARHAHLADHRLTLHPNLYDYMEARAAAGEGPIGNLDEFHAMFRRVEASYSLSLRLDSTGRLAADPDPELDAPTVLARGIRDLVDRVQIAGPRPLRFERTDPIPLEAEPELAAEGTRTLGVWTPGYRPGLAARLRPRRRWLVVTVPGGRIAVRRWTHRAAERWIDAAWGDQARGVTYAVRRDDRQ